MTFKLDIKTGQSPKPLIHYAEKQFVHLIHDSEDEPLSVYRFTLRENLYLEEKYGEIGWYWTGKTITIEEAKQKIESGHCYLEIK